MITFSDLKIFFNNNQITDSNRSNCVMLEIEAIDKLIKTGPGDLIFNYNSAIISKFKELKPQLEKNGFFYGKAFYEYLMGKTPENIEKEHVKEAVELAKYYEWLKNSALQEHKESNKIKLNLSQKLLALHYLGFETKYPNTKTAKILSAVLNSSESNIREKLSYLVSGENKVRTEDNLDVVRTLFREVGIKDLTE